jgi:hypothetical protein
MFELDDARRDELVEEWAAWIHNKGLSTPAVFLLEAHKPLGGIGAHATIAFRPFVAGLTSLDATELAAFMRERENIERLIIRLETLVGEEQAERRRRTQRRRAVRRRARQMRRARRHPGRQR